MTNNNLSYVSGCSCPTELLAAYLDHLTAPFVWNLDSYVKDTTHMLNILDFFRFRVGEGQRSNFTMDIKSLYTVILVWTGPKAPSTKLPFQTKTELFCSGYGYRLHYNVENDHRKTEPFENALQRGAI